MDPITIALGLARIVPMVTRWVAGDKAGKAAEKMVEVAEQVTGLKGIEAQKAIADDPKLAFEFEKALLDNEAELERLYVGDRQNARSRDIEILKAGRTNTRANWMIVGDVVGLLVCLAALCFLPKETPGEVRGMLATFASYFGLGLRDAHQFEFGSSRGSKDKDVLAGIKG